MSSRASSPRAAWLSALGVAVLTTATAVAVGGDDRVRLDAAALSQSRGGNTGNVLTE